MMRHRTWRTLAGAAALALLATACASSTSSGDVEVRPFAEVQDSELVFENDPTFPGRGIFRMTTTEPMICAIVWGPTEALGNFNNSLAMNGTGIVQHDVLLPGAEPGETYFYRVQGSTADGTLFASELMSFTLPAAVDAGSAGPAIDRGPNLAEGGIIVGVSSEFSPAFQPANAIDGSLETEWSSSGDGDASFITIDLGAETPVGAIEFLTRTMADGSATTTSFTLTVDDQDTYGPFPAGSPADANTTEVEFSGRVLRFDVDSSTGGNTGAIEIRVFGP